MPYYSYAAENAKVDVLFDITKEMDTKYGNPEVQERLLDILVNAGITYEFTPEHVTLDELFLDEYKILVIWDPDGTYSDAEKQAIYDFVDSGGILLYLGISYLESVQIVVDDANDLLAPYDIQISKDQVLDLTDYYGCKCGTTPIISNFVTDSFFYNLDEIALRHTARLDVAEPAFAIAMGDEDAFVDINFNEMHDEDESVGDIPVIAQRNLDGGGIVIVFGTEKTFEDTSITLSGNTKFAINLFSDLVSTYNTRPVEGSPSNTMYYVGAGIGVVIMVGALALFGKRKKGDGQDSN